MGKNSGIAWTDHTFNLWWGCDEVSPACDNCYARILDARFGGDHWGKDKPRRFFGDKHWNEPLKWDRAAAEQGTNDLVFVESMGDLLEKREDLEPHRQRFWELVRKTHALTYLLLSKRPQFFEKMIPKDLVGDPRLWLGTTIESPAYTWRADALNENTHAVVRFASMEPLIEKTSIAAHLVTDSRIGLNWVITGCESGAGARHTPTDWYRKLQRECAAAAVPFFLKQAPRGADGITSGEGSWLKLKDGIIEQPYLDGVQYIQFPRAA